VEVLDRPDVVVEVSGEGAAELAGAGEQHLVVRAVRHAFDVAGVAQPAGLHLVCRNAIPHGRGLGSSAAAVVGGLVAGRELAGGEAVDDHALLRAATRLEGHPDNAAAALLGGLTIAWGSVEEPDAVTLAVHRDLAAVLLVPTSRLATHHARSVLPASVSHEDAAANVARTALLVHALTSDPGLLLPATLDRLHQRQRAAAMPETIGLVDRLRGDGLAAVVSGAGPSVLVLTTSDHLDDVRGHCAGAAGPGWQCLTPDVGGPGAAVVG
ncbi:MAG TPA: homoserine kinase, partial [Angustibacter sp.]|nr:homoserine kinase [Angustibacter sp.]